MNVATDFSVTNRTTGRLGKAFTCIYTLSLPQRLRLTVGWEEGGRGELVTVAGFTAGQHCGQLAVWTLHAEVETLKGRSGPRRRTDPDFSVGCSTLGSPLLPGTYLLTRALAQLQMGIR